MVSSGATETAFSGYCFLLSTKRECQKNVAFFKMEQVGKKRTSSVLDVTEPEISSKFGSRILTEDNDVFKHNAW